MLLAYWNDPLTTGNGASLTFTGLDTGDYAPMPVDMICEGIACFVNVVELTTEGDVYLRLFVDDQDIITAKLNVTGIGGQFFQSGVGKLITLSPGQRVRLAFDMGTFDGRIEGCVGSIAI